MIVGSEDWDEVEIDFKYEVPHLYPDYIVVHGSFPAIKELMEIRPEWFVQIFAEATHLFAIPLEHYRAGRLWSQHPEWGGMKIDDFIERVVSGASPADHLRSNDDPA